MRHHCADGVIHNVLCSYSHHLCIKACVKNLADRGLLSQNRRLKCLKGSVQSFKIGTVTLRGRRNGRDRACVASDLRLRRVDRRNRRRGEGERVTRPIDGDGKALAEDRATPVGGVRSNVADASSDCLLYTSDAADE